MATQLQIRRGTTAQMNAFTGAEGELAVNTSTDTLHVHNGATAGGFPLARADGSNIATYAGSFTTLAASSTATLNTLASSGATLTGGTINGMSVGATTASTGSFTTVSASGAITGNVTGNVTGNLTGSVLTAAQTNITSLGSLTGLTVTGALAANGGAVFNEASADVDFRVESDGNTHALFVEGSTSNVGIGTNSPSSYFSGATNLVLSGTGDSGLTINSGTSNLGRIHFADGTSGADQYRGYIVYQHADNSMQFATNSLERMRITSTGVGIGMVPPSDRNLAVYNANNSIFSLHNSTTGTGPSDGFQLQLVSDDAYLVNYEAGGNLIFYTAPSGGSSAERMRIDSSGNLLVGKTSTSIGTAGHTIFASGEVFHTVAGTSLYVNRTGSDGPIQNFYRNGVAIGSIGSVSGAYTQFNSVNTGYLAVSDTNEYAWDSVRFYPNTDNTNNLGLSTRRWNDAYITNGVTTGSDRNQKQDIETLSDAEQRVAVACKGLLRKWRWIDAVEAKGDDARIHFGIIAQDLQDAFTAEGLDAGRYAMFCSDTFWVDSEGESYDTAEEAPEGATEQTRLGVRYSELLAFIISVI